jgi:hypothetical protein
MSFSTTCPANRGKHTPARSQPKASCRNHTQASSAQGFYYSAKTFLKKSENNQNSLCIKSFLCDSPGMRRNDSKTHIKDRLKEQHQPSPQTTVVLALVISKEAALRMVALRPSGPNHTTPKPILERIAIFQGRESRHAQHTLSSTKQLEIFLWSSSRLTQVNQMILFN